MFFFINNIRPAAEQEEVQYPEQVAPHEGLHPEQLDEHPPLQPPEQLDEHAVPQLLEQLDPPQPLDGPPVQLFVQPQVELPVLLELVVPEQPEQYPEQPYEQDVLQLDPQELEKKNI